MTVDIKCSIISSSSSSVVRSCQIAMQFARDKKQRARGKERKKKKNEGKGKERKEEEENKRGKL